MEHKLQNVDKIDLYLNKLIARRLERIDYIIKRKTYIFFLIQSLHVFIYNDLAFDKHFVIRNGRIEFPYMVSKQREEISHIKKFNINDDIEMVTRNIFNVFWKRDIESLEFYVHRLSPSIHHKVTYGSDTIREVIEIDNSLFEYDLTKSFSVWTEFFTIPEEIIEKWKDKNQLKQQNISSMMKILKKY